MFGISGAAFGRYPLQQAWIGPETISSPWFVAACFASLAGRLVSSFDAHKFRKGLLMARPGRLLRCNDTVRQRMNVGRAGETAGTPLRDPLQKWGHEIEL